MTDIAHSAEIDDSPVGFQNNAAMQKDWETQPFIKVSLSMSESETKIQLASCIVDARKVICSFIENDGDISKYTSLTETTILIQRLSLRVNEPIYRLASKPMQPSKIFFTQCENSFEIWFRDCDDFAAGEVYDRLIYAISSIYDYFAENVILARLKRLILTANPLFQTANAVRLLGYKPLAFDEYAILQIKDILKLESWAIGATVAKGIYESLDKQIKILVIPSEAIETLIADLHEREKYIVVNRFLESSKTLEELGAELGLTRERVRQIASKVERKFHASHSKMNLIKTVFYSLKVLCDSEHCFALSELDKYGVSEGGLKFLSEVLDGNFALIHISDTDCIAFADKDGKCDWLEHIENVTHSIPALLLPDEQQSIVEAIIAFLKELGYEIPEHIIATIVFRKYIKNGSALVKKSLRMGDRFEIVLEKFFPDGIRLYQAEDMALFRKRYDALFEDDKISDNDHAVISRVADRCVLIDRGTYILNKKTELPAELAQRILEFVIQYLFDMVMTNSIMHKFNSELTAIGVDNKYYLLSVLKQHFADKFSFRRDYVIKGENTGNFYGNITGFVEPHPGGVSFHDLQLQFQGIPDAVLYFALSEDDNIIPMYNKMYIHKSNIIFPEHQKVLPYLRGVVTQEHIVSDERALGLIKRYYPDFVANNNINTSWFLFSVLRSFFHEEFNFSRPHIIDLTFDSANGREALRSSFWGKKYVEILDIKNYAKEKQIQIYDLSKLLDSYCDRYFILNKERLISIDEIGYSPDEFAHVEDIVIDALEDLGYADIAKLNVVNILPRANIAITEWLIYSIINKYGTRLTAITSTSQFMNSAPLVVRNGADIETIREDFASSGASAQTVRIDDLSDIDSLVERIIDLEFMWREGK